jgi:hypothetical protein
MFYLLAMGFNVKIHSYREMELNEEMARTTTGKLMVMINNAFNADSAQMYTEALSDHISKSYDKTKGASKYNIKWGTYTAKDNWKEFWGETVTNNKGEEKPRLSKKGNLTVTADEDRELKEYILGLLNCNLLRSEVIESVGKNKGIKIQQPFLSKNFRKVGRKYVIREGYRKQSA